MCRNGPAQRIRRINRSQLIPFVNTSRSVSLIYNMVFVSRDNIDICTFIVDLAAILKIYLEDSQTK